VSEPILKAEEFLIPADREKVRQAIRDAELITSGEIRVHLDDHIEGDVLDHAAFVFEELDMHRTKERNGVLFYVSVVDHKVAVIGDVGINEKVEDGFWLDVLDVMRAHFASGTQATGLIEGIKLAGEKLASHFPIRSDDRNELSDEITYSE